MKKPPPPPRPVGPDPGGRSTVVGSLPWDDRAGNVSTPRVPGPVRGGIGGIAHDGLSDERPASLAEWIDRLIRLSPPFSVSLAVHVLVLLILALWFVRIRHDRRVVLDVSFLSTEVVDAPNPGVQITPEPEPVPEPDPVEVKSVEPPVEQPIAAPPVMTEPVETTGGAIAEAAAPAVGMLLQGREEGRRAALVDAFGGSTATEAAVARALEWLARQQDKKDGLWSLRGPYGDGGSQENRLAATAMALLAFQGAGNTPHEGPHRKVVERAWKALARAQLADGRFDVTPPPPTHHALYSHAQATIAACELHGMARDGGHLETARKALAYAIAAQGPNGGWRYEPGQEGDMSVTGWYMMALKSGQMAGLDVPDPVFGRITDFLDTVAVQDGTRYGYRIDVPGRPPVQVTNAICAEGLLCRQYLGWKRNDPRLVQGLELLVGNRPFDWDGEKDVYAWYYVTQVSHHLGGGAWDRWNDRMKEVLPGKQVAKGAEAGSWDPSLDRWGHIGGRLFVTCFCTWMLEVYYRHLPLYGDEAVAAAVAP